MKKVVILIVLSFTLAVPTLVKADWLQILGHVLSNSSGNRTGAALDYLKREAGYKALETFLENRHVAGAHYFVEAVRASVEKDYSEAAVTFRMGLDESGLKLEAGVELLNASAVIVRPASSEVADKIEGLTQYVSNR